MDKKYIKPIRPHVPDYSLKQEDYHQQQVELFDALQDEFRQSPAEAGAFNEEKTQHSEKEEQQKQQYLFDPHTGLWKN